MNRSLASLVTRLATTAVVAMSAATASAAPLPQEAGAAAAEARAPDAASVRQAADAFEAGVAAFKSRQFEIAASRFEAADAAVPSPQALRQAIRARSGAGQGSRAATLAAQALERYSDDAGTVQLATETIARLAPALQKVVVTCGAPCILAAGTRAIPGEARSRWVVYLDPGSTALSASFADRGGSAQATIDAHPGGSDGVRLEPAPAPATAPAPAPVTPPERATPVAPVTPPERATPVAPASRSDAAATPSRGGLPPLVFFGGLLLTAGLGGALVWSGVDTVNNPGADAVRAACAGRGTSCPEYQDGLGRQTRTNVLVGATAGAGALTLAAALFTDWGGAKKVERVARVAPLAFVTDRGAVVGVSARGNF